MTAVRLVPASLHFSPTGGTTFASADKAETGQKIARHLPAIRPVETLEEQGLVVEGLVVADRAARPCRLPARV